MKKLLILFILVMNISVHADGSDFCNGFSEGYKTVKGDLVIVPICPIEPITPIGSNSYREGIKAGIRAAQ